MQVKSVGVRYFRENFAKIAEMARENFQVFVVTQYKKPILEIRPCYNESLDFDEIDSGHLKMVENNLDFWNDSADDDIFEIN